MYKILSSMIIIMIGCAVSSAFNYQIPLAATPPVIDGNALTGEWDSALNVNVSYPEILATGGTNITGTPTHADLSAGVKMLWDKNNLYIFVRVFDNNKIWSKNYPGPYNGQDCFQIAFNPNNNPNATFLQDAPIFDFVPQTLDNHGVSAYSHDGYFTTGHFVLAGKELDDGWQMEIAIPWTGTFSTYAYPGSRHGFAMLLPDYDGGSTNFLVDFGNGENTISDITTWNTITLVGEDGCGAKGRFEGDLNGDCYVTLADFALFAQQWSMNSLE